MSKEEESKEIKLGKGPEKLIFSPAHVQPATKQDQIGLNNHRI